MKASPKSKHAAKGKRAKSQKRRASVVENRYEDATFQWGERSWLPASVQDARIDADASTRLELIRRARYWSRNSSLSIDCGDIFAQYVVGPNGLQMIPSYAGASGEITDEAEAWDESASRWWSSWAKAPFVDSEMSLAMGQNQMAHSWWHDGEVIIYKTYDRESREPRIQLIESHRISTPPELRSQEGRSIVDGVEFRPDVDGRPSGKPLRYWLRVDSGSSGYAGGWSPSLYGGGNFRPVPASQIIHLADPDRPGMVRSLPKATGRMNDLHDLEDLQMMEKKAARDASEITNIVTNKTGEADGTPMRRQKWQIQGQDAAGNAVIKQAPLFYEMTLGGRTIYKMSGEKVEQFKSERPSVTTIEFWNYLIRKVAGPMWCILLPQQVQGTQYRAFLEVVNTYFRTHTAVLANAMEDVYTWALGWGVDYDRSLDGAPDDWYHVEVIPPRSIIVDIGRNSQAQLKELQAGTLTYRDWCGEKGHDWRKVLRQKAIEAKFINRLVDEYDVPGRQIAELAAESLRVTEKISESKAEREAEQPDTPGGSESVEKTEKVQPAALQPITVNTENALPPITINIENKPSDKLKQTKEIKFIRANDKLIGATVTE